MLTAAKAYAALIGSICTALLGIYAADTGLGKVLTVAAAVATAVATYRVPNATKDRGEDGAAEPSLLCVLVLIGVVLLLFGVRFR